MMNLFSRLKSRKVVLAAGGVFRSLGSSEVASKWRDAGRAIGASRSHRDKELHAMLKKSIPAALEHTGAASFDEHLIGVQAVLRSWVPDDEELCDAMLFHSIYGTEGFAGYALPWSERTAVRKLIGHRAERYAWLFCAMDRSSFDVAVMGLDSPEDLGKLSLPVDVSHGGPGEDPATSLAIPRSLPGDMGRLNRIRARPELGAFALPLVDENEFLDLCTLVLCDFLEQVEGAASKPNPG
jgi:hypothetical protein